MRQSKGGPSFKAPGSIQAEVPESFKAVARECLCSLFHLLHCILVLLLNMFVRSQSQATANSQTG